MKKMKAGIVGCGNIGSLIDKYPGKKPVYTHAGAYFLHPNYELITGADTNKKRLYLFGKKWGIKKIYLDYRKMIDKEMPDIVSVCTPKEFHYEIVRYAAEKGVKVIFCEKPFTGNPYKARELINLCKRRNVMLAINFTRRYVYSFRKIKQIISEGELGLIQKVNCLYTKGIINNGSHMIDILSFIFGNSKTVKKLSPTKKSSLIKNDFDVDFKLDFKKGFIAYIFCCEGKHYGLFEIDIIGSLGRIRVTDSGFEIKHYRVHESPLFKGYKELEAEGMEIRSGMENAFTCAIENIYRAYHKKENLLCSGIEALNTVEIIKTLLKRTE